MTAIRRGLGKIISPVASALGLGGKHDKQQPPPSPSGIKQAQDQWRSDTGTVSQSLSDMESFCPSELKRKAAIPLVVEKDELNHQAILDRQFLSGDNPDSYIQQADSMLVRQAKFQFVIGGLQNLTDYGSKMSPKEVVAASRDLNEDRCTFVLPAIDACFKALTDFLRNGESLQAITV